MIDEQDKSLYSLYADYYIIDILSVGCMPIITRTYLTYVVCILYHDGARNLSYIKGGVETLKRIYIY